MKRLTGQAAKPQLSSLINSAADGDAQLLADLINESLRQVSRDLSALSPPEATANSADTDDTTCQFLVEPYEVFNKLSQINIHKSSGPDGIPNWFLRDFAFAISDPICHIFNSSISGGAVPSLWKRANVIPIPKTCPPKSIQDDLRPISLTPTLSKVLESLVGRWILAKTVGKFDPRQFGALKGRSTTHALIDITHMWHQALDDHNSARILFIDYSKAFDHVDHKTVLSKMKVFGIDPPLLKWMHSFLLNRQQRVKVGNAFSKWTTMNGGMPQGTWLGPYVFLILIDDLRTIMPTVKFVDDVTVTEIINLHSSSQMQTAADQISEWSQRNLMNINVKKTKEMLLGPILKNPPDQIVLNTVNIERVTSFKLLGITVMNNMSWENHVSAICAKSSKRLHFLTILKRSAVSPTDLLQFYKCVIRPVIEYACPVWQSSLTSDQSDRLESVQRRALKIIYNSSDYELMCALHSVEPISVRLDSLARTFFIRVSRPDDCLNRLLPAERSEDILNRLRQPNRLPFAICRTNRFLKSFLPYSLSNYQ
jgi:hypothetical protein